MIGLAFFTFCRLQRNEQLWRGAGVADCRLKRRQAEELIISPALHVLLWTSTVLRGRRAVLVHAGWYPAVSRAVTFATIAPQGLFRFGWQPPKARYTVASHSTHYLRSRLHRWRPSPRPLQITHSPELSCHLASDIR